MSSTNGGPSVTTTPNVVVQAVPAGSSSVPFDPSSVAITGGTIADLIGGKLRRAAAAAAIANPLTNPPLTLAPAWALSTAYALGNVVSNGGNLYICYTAGTSAASGGPSGTGAAPITDNTVVWHFYGVSRITANSVVAPTFTAQTTTPSGLTSLYTAISNASNFLLAGGTPTAAPSNPGTQVAFPSTDYKIGSGGNCGYNDGRWNFGWSVTFETDAPKFAYGTSNNTQPLRVIIDGQYFYDGGDSNNTGNPAWRVFDFAATGGRKTRRVTIEGPGNTYFAGVRVDPQSLVWAPNVEQVKVAVLGSSIEQGGNLYPILPYNAWCHQLAKMMGWSDVRNLGIGGSGYVLAGSGTNYAGHLSDATSFSPDIVFVGGPINDVNGSVTAAAIQAAALSLYQQIRAALPSAIIVALGTYPGNTGPSAAHIAGEAAVQAAVTAFADAKTFFLPVVNDTQGSWISGTGKITATTGTGNADVIISSDGTHPWESAIGYYARRVHASFRERVLKLFI